MSETGAQGGRNICVLVDMDMVICDFETHLLTEFRTRHPTLRFIPLDNRMGFSVKEQYGKDISNDAAVSFCFIIMPCFFTPVLVPGLRKRCY